MMYKRYKRYATYPLSDLEDERWLSLARYIRKRDNLSCRFCGTKGVELHVHHTIYIERKRAWEYPDENLITLCKTCHNKIDHSCIKIFEDNRTLNEYIIKWVDKYMNTRATTFCELLDLYYEYIDNFTQNLKHFLYEIVDNPKNNLGYTFQEVDDMVDYVEINFNYENIKNESVGFYLDIMDTLRFDFEDELELWNDEDKLYENTFKK